MACGSRARRASFGSHREDAGTRRWRDSCTPHESLTHQRTKLSESCVESIHPALLCGHVCPSVASCVADQQCTGHVDSCATNCVLSCVANCVHICEAIPQCAQPCSQLCGRVSAQVCGACSLSAWPFTNMQCGQPCGPLCTNAPAPQ